MAETLVTYADYVDISGDETTASAIADSKLTQAIGLVEEALDRFLRLAEYTESLLVQRRAGAIGGYVLDGGYGGRAYPRGYPVQSVSSPSGATVDTNNRIIRGLSVVDFLFEPNDRHVDVTYTGGYERATLPDTLKLIIVDVARALVLKKAGQLDTGAGYLSKQLGDAKVQYAPWNGASRDLEALVPGMASRLHGWRKRTST